MKCKDVELFNRVRDDFVKAMNRYNLTWTNEYIDKMTDDLCIAIQKGKVLPPTIKYLRD